MAGLTDMEELVARVKSPTLVSYLREALSCYGTGAYRATIVLTFIALFEDLREKTRVLAKVNSSAKRVSIAIEELAEGQKPFENQIVEQLQAEGLLTELQGQRLKQIVSHRNKAAHPSGVSASAEEARFVFFECIDRFLSQPVLSTTHAVDDILDRIRSANFFPSRVVSDITDVVANELTSVHSSAFPMLVDWLVSIANDTDKTVETNVRFFLLGVSLNRRDTWRPLILSKLVQPKSHDPSYAKAIVGAISVDPIIIKELNRTTRMRVASLMANSIEKMSDGGAQVTNLHPLAVCGNLFRHLDEDDVFPDFEVYVKKVVGRYQTNPSLLRYIKTSPIAVGLFTSGCLLKAGSGDFNLANPMANALPSIDQLFAELIDSEPAFRLLAAVRKAAEIGAYRSQELLNNHFDSLPHLRKRAAAFAVAERSSAVQMALEYSSESEAESFVDAVAYWVDQSIGNEDEELPF